MNPERQRKRHASRSPSEGRSLGSAQSFQPEAAPYTNHANKNTRGVIMRETFPDFKCPCCCQCFFDIDASIISLPCKAVHANAPLPHGGHRRSSRIVYSGTNQVHSGASSASSVSSPESDSVLRGESKSDPMDDNTVFPELHQVCSVCWEATPIICGHKQCPTCKFPHPITAGWVCPISRTLAASLSMHMPCGARITRKMALQHISNCPKCIRTRLGEYNTRIHSLTNDESRLRSIQDNIQSVIAATSDIYDSPDHLDESDEESELET